MTFYVVINSHNREPVRFYVFMLLYSRNCRNVYIMIKSGYMCVFSAALSIPKVAKKSLEHIGASNNFF